MKQESKLTDFRFHWSLFQKKSKMSSPQNKFYNVYVQYSLQITHTNTSWSCVRIHVFSISNTPGKYYEWFFFLLVAFLFHIFSKQRHRVSYDMVLQIECNASSSEGKKNKLPWDKQKIENIFYSVKTTSTVNTGLKTNKT